jgi:hypothetical protein
LAAIAAAVRSAATRSNAPIAGEALE